MKANRNIQLTKDTEGQVGIGTLIVFIAMVLVAAVAAAVLIQTSGVLQQRAQQTGSEATQEVSSNLDIKNIEGIRSNGTSGLSPNIDLLRLQVGLQAGSSPVDINQVIATITDGRQTNTLSYIQQADDSSLYDNNDWKKALEEMLGNETYARNYFTVQEIRDEDQSFYQDNPVMNTGDLINIYISTASIDDNQVNHSITGVDSSLKNTGMILEPRTSVEIVMTPEAGATTIASFVTPSTYGVNTIVKLYP
ncbi:flagellin [Methanosalsum zhilinae DSM 4017]|uniref:Flagellin n=1 Tax=Methanosalsum zhilinae (strain DSM 4017 / NBRC 107636 / OCM 62 / WeN5) TaxID=679901 RepID=F7XQ63_METZD|nr:archaellin/type IV pilin N-terminal domain-containing protein [Methanosalsum zhilinae]AEH60425.1 flagellin [Methanosalsum zhilinae DSM 4017]